jgi:ferredoxin
VGDHAVVDREMCMGSAVCLVYAPGTFAHDDQGKAVVRTPAVDPPDAISAAVEACPASALRLVVDDTVVDDTVVDDTVPDETVPDETGA